MNTEGIYRKWFRVAKNELNTWKVRCEVAMVIAGFSLLCNLWQYCRQ